MGQEGPTMTNRDVVCTAPMEDILNIKDGGPVALPEIAQGKGVEGAGPLIAGLNTETVAEGVVRVVFETVPGRLAKIELQAVVTGVAFGDQFSARPRGRSAGR